MLSTRILRTILAAATIGTALPGSASAALIFLTYYEDWVSASCDSPDVGLNGDGCQFTFSAIAGPKPVLITRVSCTISIDPGATTPVIKQFYLGTISGATFLPLRTVGLLPQKLSTDADNVTYYLVNDKVRVLYGATQAPLLFIGMEEAADVEARCTITGTTAGL